MAIYIYSRALPASSGVRRSLSSEGDEALEQKSKQSETGKIPGDNVVDLRSYKRRQYQQRIR
jgi:hypothetical protein